MKRCLILFLALFCLGGAFRACAQPRDSGPRDFLRWNPDRQGQFITALCADRRGVLWVGTEDKGLWKRETTGAWIHYSTENGLSDNTILSLAVDTRDRLWAGTAGGGVVVWNGEQWSVFDLLSGPLSERVHDIAVSPQTGEVWLATDMGLARYSDESGWRYLTRLDGLASNQIAALAFDAQANLFVATACEGLSIGHADDDYQSWTNIQGAAIQPNTPVGEGLPSNQLSDVAVDSLSNIWVATYFGLSKSSDGGKTWSFLRGNNWAQNVTGSALGLQPSYVKVDIDLLAEDGVVKLEPTSDGHLWLGYRQKGFELRTATGQVVYSSGNAPGANLSDIDFVDAICPITNGAVVGSYGKSLQLTGSGNHEEPVLETKAVPPTEAPLPEPVAPPNLEQMQVLWQRIASLPNDNTVSGGFYGLDWRTRGNWVGRYGDRNTRLYAMASPFSHDIARTAEGYTIGPEMVGPRGGSTYFYLYELESTDPKVLYDPILGKRRPGEINDGAWDKERYAFSWEGPDLWVTVQVPAGTHRLALYFANFNGHTGINRFRDYVVHLKPYREDLKEAEATADIARARLSNFWSGGYVQFWLNGPDRFRVKIARGRSHAVILQATLLDQIRGPEHSSDQVPMPWMGGVRYVTEVTPPPVADENEVIRAARALWMSAEDTALRPGAIEAAWMARLLAYRAAAAAKAPEALLENWRWKLAIWQESDAAGFDNTMAAAYTKLQQEQNSTPPIEE